MKSKILVLICFTISLAGCTQNISENNSYSEGAQTFQTENENSISEESSDLSPKWKLPPDEKIAPIVRLPMPELPVYETSEEVPVGHYGGPDFVLDGVVYADSVIIYDFVIDDDGEIVVGIADDSEDEIAIALNELHSLEYVGASPRLDGDETYWFRYGDALLFVVKFPAAATQNLEYKDMGYREDQFYAAGICEPAERAYAHEETSH